VRAAGDPYVVEVDQRPRAPALPLLEPQHLLEVHPAVAELDELDGRVVDRDAAEEHLAREQVGEPVGHPHARQVGEEAARSVADDQVLDGEIVDERTRDRADLHLADHDPVERL
jgi:hypothetical protein